MARLGDELTVDGVTYVLVDSTRIRLMTGSEEAVCYLCQARSVICKAPWANNRAYDICKCIASAIFVKKLEV